MIKSGRFIVVFCLFILVGLFLNFHSDIAVPTNKPFQEFPVRHLGWQLISQAEFSENILNVLKPTDYLSRQYQDQTGKPVSLYIGYHGGGKSSGEIHSPKHCLPGSGWFEVSTQQSVLDSGLSKINLVQAIYQNGDQKELFLYWFQVREKTLSNEYMLKLSQIVNSLLYRRRDSTFVRISVPFETDQKAAQATGERFIRDFFPLIKEYLPN